MLTGLLVIITGFYAWATYKILRANENIVEVARQEAESISRPYINISTFTIPDNPIIFLSIENTGKTPANNLCLQIDKDFYQFGEKKEGGNLKELEVFCNSITCFSPGSKLPFYLGVGHQLFNEKSDPVISPITFKITAEYEFGDKKVKEETVIDLKMHLNSALEPDAIVSELKNVKESINMLPKALGKELKP